MAVEIKLPTVLRVQADGQATVAVDGSTVGDVFNTLVERYPGLLDTAGAPPELLPWIGSFLGVTMDSAWGPDQRRAVIAALPGLFLGSGSRRLRYAGLRLLSSRRADAKSPHAPASA